MFRIIFKGLLLLLFTMGFAFAHELDPITVNATITPTAISLSPNTVPANTPLILHVINQAGAPVELENSDTSVEVYTGMDKTFKIGLPAGQYVFFNDFNSQTKTATLSVGIATESVSVAPVATPSSNVASVSPLQKTEILFIVWREAVEALLVIGIVYGWLKQVEWGRRSGFIALWSGVGVGLLITVCLSMLLIRVSGELKGNAQTYLQTGMTLLAAGMIFYMVQWMRKNARQLKSNMHSSFNQASLYWRNFAILAIVAVAMAREGSEAAVFIYALGFGQAGVVSPAMLGVLALGVVLALLTIYILQLSQRFFSWKTFFRITEILLLLLGGGMLLHALDLLNTAGWLPFLQAKVWNTAFLISDSNIFAPVLSSFTGYRAAPSQLDVLVYLLYWLMVYVFIFRKARPSRPRS